MISEELFFNNNLNIKKICLKRKYIFIQKSTSF